MMSILTRGQTMARAAYDRVHGHVGKKPDFLKEYRSFAREFPTLVHQCGLAQAVAFAQAKGGRQADYAGDLAAVLTAARHKDVPSLDSFANASRSLPLSDYLRLGRDAIEAAVWIKRYVEALFPEEKPS